MVNTTGQDVTILLNGSDYSQYIYDYSENGGEIIRKFTKNMNNSFDVTTTDITNHEVEIQYKLNSTMNNLFTNNTPISIEITSGSDLTISYDVMYPQSFSPRVDPEDLTMGSIKFVGPFYVGSSYNRRYS